jgi:hypothetical protein
MLTYALLAFAMAALGGAILAYLRIVKNTMSMPLALGHGLLAATGLGLLTYGVIETGGTLLTTALVVFLLAVLGGFTLFSYHLRAKQLPIPLVLIHGTAAVTAFVILLIATLGIRLSRSNSSGALRRLPDAPDENSPHQEDAGWVSTRTASIDI